MGLRRRSREIALQILFQREFSPKGDPEEQLNHFAEGFAFEKDALDYARTLVIGITTHLESIDRQISEQSSHWKTSRMALVDLNLMRVAVFEMTKSEPQIPPKVAINEAIDLAKRYGTADSGAFVNGILDRIAHQLYGANF